MACPLRFRGNALLHLPICPKSPGANRYNNVSLGIWSQRVFLRRRRCPLFCHVRRERSVQAVPGILVVDGKQSVYALAVGGVSVPA